MMFGHRKARDEEAADVEVAVEVHLEDDIVHIASCVVAFLENPQHPNERQALGAALEELDEQTALGDAYLNNNASRFRGTTEPSPVIGATSDYSPGEDVPSALFNSQVILVKAAKAALATTTPATLSMLQRALDNLPDVGPPESGTPD